MRALGLCGALFSLFLANGCVGGCGVGPVQSSDGGQQQSATVDANGIVTFTSIVVGNASSFDMPVKDSADVDETIVTADLTGDGASAFTVLTQLPLAVPAGESVTVTVEFLPTTAGDFAAELVLHTEKMGPSPIQLKGEATAN